MAKNSNPDITPEERIEAERGAALVAAAMSETFAPQSLREAIERDRARAAARPVRRRGFGRLLGPAGVPVVVATVAAFVGLGVYVSSQDNEGGPTPASIAEVASLGGLPAGSPAPAAQGRRLNVSVDGIAFPNWKRLKWPATGRRTDHFPGHRVMTVFYQGPAGQRLGYSIVGGAGLKGWPAGSDVRRGYERYRVTHSAGRTIVVWTQRGHTCVVSAPSSVPDGKLIDLAATESV